MAKNHTHIAVHTVQANVDGKTVEYKAGTPFTPDAASIEYLEGQGAIRKATKEDLADAAAAEGGSVVDRGNAPAGYAAGTQPATAGGALKGDENDVLKVTEVGGPEPRVSSASSSDEASDNAPSSRTTRR